MSYRVFSIVETAVHRCGLPVLARTLHQTAVQARCPFCADHAYHLYLYRASEQYHCFRCGAHGNAVALYAALHGLEYAQAYHALCMESDEAPIYRAPAAPPVSACAPLARRDAVYRALLALLPLCASHTCSLRSRGLSETAIRRNAYRTMPSRWDARQALVRQLETRFDLTGVPGFGRDARGMWSLFSWGGLVVPVRDLHAQIQGVQLRLDEPHGHKYCWLSSAGKPDGAGAQSWVHIAGDVSRRIACITEGALKGDVASALCNRALFVCVPGVTAIRQLNQTLTALAVDKVIEAFDMDKTTKPQVMDALQRMRRTVSQLGLAYEPYCWDAHYKGIDDYLRARERAS